MKKSKLCFLFAFVFLCSTCLISYVYAIPIEGEFSWVIDNVISSALIPSDIRVGTQIVGNFAYDTDSPVVYSETDTEYYSNDNTITFTIIGDSENYFFESIFPNIIVHDGYVDYVYFPFIMGFPTSMLIEGYYIDEASFYLQGDGSIFDDTSLPTYLDLDDFSNTSFWLTFYAVDHLAGFEVNGHLETFSAHPVPEPSTIILFVSGIVGLAGYGRKHRVLIG